MLYSTKLSRLFVFIFNKQPIVFSFLLLFSFGEQKAEKELAKIAFATLIVGGSWYAYKKWANTPKTALVKPVTEEEYRDAQKKLDTFKASDVQDNIIKLRWQEINTMVSEGNAQKEKIKTLQSDSLHPCRPLRERFKEWHDGSDSLITHVKQYSSDNYLCGQLIQETNSAQTKLDAIQDHLQKKVFQDQLIPAHLSTLKKEFVDEWNAVKTDFSKLPSYCEKYYTIIQNDLKKKQIKQDQMRPQLQEIINRYHKQSKTNNNR